MWDLPRPGMELLSPAPAGRFLTLGQQGSPPGPSCSAQTFPVSGLPWTLTYNMSSPHFSFFALSFSLLHSVYWSLKLPSWLMFSPIQMGFPGSSVVESACQCRRRRFTPGLGRSPGEGNGNPLQCLAWEISWTEEPGGHSSWSHKESDRTEHTHTHTPIPMSVP